MPTHRHASGACCDARYPPCPHRPHQVFMFGFAFAVVSPVILPVAWCFFLTAFVTYRYALLYVFERSYESGGSSLLNRTSHSSSLSTLVLHAHSYEATYGCRQIRLLPPQRSDAVAWYR